MSRDGNGNYTLPAGNPVVAGTTITDTWANTTLNDIASALTFSLAKDGQTVPTANLPMGGFKLTGLGDGSASGQALVYGQTTQASLTGLTLTGGTANGVAYLNGSKVLTSGTALQFDGSNLGINTTPNSWGASYRALQAQGGALMGDANNAYVIGNLYYDGTNWKYRNTAQGAVMTISGAGITWQLAGSGTAGTNATLSTAMTLDTSGNLGLGVVPNAWAGLGGGSAFQGYSWGIAAPSGGDTTDYLTNAYQSAVNTYKYRFTAAAVRYSQYGGQHQFHVAASGTAGNTITWTQALTVDANARVYGSALHNNAAGVTGTANQYIASGTYTPTGNSVSNVNVISAPNPAQWIRVGNVVTVSGSVSVSATSAGNVQWRLTFPIASTLVQESNCSGSVGGVNAGTCFSGFVQGNTGTNDALLQLTAPDTASHLYHYHFTYVVL